VPLIMLWIKINSSLHGVGGGGVVCLTLNVDSCSSGQENP
jgi:hypothetical protein